MAECQHEWKQEYYGIRCTKCDLFYPDNSNWFAPQDDDYDEDDERTHSLECTCETCIQNHPERMIYLPDDDDDDDGEPYCTCLHPGQLKEDGTCRKCGLPFFIRR
jgi:hypothetical protein